MKETSPISRSGRFRHEPSGSVVKFTESVSFDWRLYKYDILGSRAHAEMLQKIGILTRTELDEINRAFDKIEESIESGTFKWSTELEDVHMNIEAALTQITPAGAKIHTGRSRNDQVALDLRLWLRDEIRSICSLITEFQMALVQTAERFINVPIPGYTHLQRAQPVLFSHHLLAYVEMFQRDKGRFEDTWERANECPLGSGAIAGSTLPLDRNFVAIKLGFVNDLGEPRVTQNSMDGVSDRDFVVEFCSDAALAAVHASRFAEDIILWNTSEFGFIRISDEYTTGSSLMPQKKNPDIAELIRGKSGRIIGNLMGTLVMLKGLPMTYNRDLQEDKEQLFDSADALKACLSLFKEMIQNISVDQERCNSAVSDPQLLATDLVEFLVTKGIPFRDAHHLVGKIIALSEDKHCKLTELTRSDLLSIDPRLDLEPSKILDLNRSFNAKKMIGAPGLEQVRQQIARWKNLLNLQPDSSSANTV